MPAARLKAGPEDREAFERRAGPARRGWRGANRDFPGMPGHGLCAQAQSAPETQDRTFLVGPVSPQRCQSPHIVVRTPRFAIPTGAQKRHLDIGKWRRRRILARPCHTCGKSQVMCLHRPSKVCHETFIGCVRINDRCRGRRRRGLEAWRVLVPAVKKLPSSSLIRVGFCGSSLPTNISIALHFSLAPRLLEDRPQSSGSYWGLQTPPGDQPYLPPPNPPVVLSQALCWLVVS